MLHRLDGNDTCAVLGVGQTDDFDAVFGLHRGEAVQKVLCKRQLVRADDIQPRFLQEAEGGVKSRKAGEVHRAGLQAVGEKVRHELGVAHAARAAREKGCERFRKAFSEDNSARALRAKQALVPREGDGVDAAFLYIDRKNARGLRAV